uniref:Uncharacterized protein n=1 Tax=Romanomermis culicivorax TaxID=13658 RepID=A0A915KQM0_ROMCU
MDLFCVDRSLFPFGMSNCQPLYFEQYDLNQGREIRKTKKEKGETKVQCDRPSGSGQEQKYAHSMTDTAIKSKSTLS